MSYTPKLDWVSANGVSAADLIRIEQGIKDALPKDGSEPMTGDLTIGGGHDIILVPAISGSNVVIYSDAGNLQTNAPAMNIGTATVWHSGNDGAGSGLDADTVDGKQNLSVVTNYNTADKAGFYIDSSGTDTGNPNGSRYVFEHLGDNNWGRQVAYNFFTNDVYTRAKRNGIWDTSWKRIWTEDQIRDNAGALEFLTGGAWKQAGMGTSSFGANGYQKLASGLILQWGRVTLSSGWTVVSFPVSFPSACRSVQLINITQNFTVGLQNDPSITGFSCGGYTGADALWFAVGY